MEPSRQLRDLTEFVIHHETRLHIISRCIQISENGAVAAEIVKIRRLIFQARRSAEQEIARFGGLPLLVKAKRPVNVARGGLWKKIAQPLAHSQRLVPRLRFHEHEKPHPKNGIVLAILRPQRIKFLECLNRHVEFDVSLRREERPVQ
jgi:hypothetical protein